MYPPSSTATSFVPSAEDATDFHVSAEQLSPVVPVMPPDMLVLPPVVAVVPPVPDAPLPPPLGAAPPPLPDAPFPPPLHPPATVTTNTEIAANFTKTEHT